MRGGKMAMLIGVVAFFVALALLNIFPHNFWAIDIRLRHNEICCAHEGVNSFRIWDGDVSHPDYLPIGRPDKKVSCSPGATRLIHAYPAWHTAFFWFYGWVPQKNLVNCFFAVNVGLAVMIGFLFWFNFYGGWKIKLCIAGGLLVFCWRPLQSFFWEALNYQVLILALSLLLVVFRVRSNLAGGLAYAVMMIKPQSAVLFGWLLVVRRRWLVIAVAAALCVGGLLFTSHALSENPITLILQIPQIGKPYVLYPGSNNIFSCVFSRLGEVGFVVWQILFFLLCGWTTWKLREDKSHLVQLLPMSVAVHIWTYSQVADWLLAWPLYLIIVKVAFKQWHERVGWLMKSLSIMAIVAGLMRIVLRSAWLSSKFPIETLVSRQADRVTYQCVFALYIISALGFGFLMIVHRIRCRSRCSLANSPVFLGTGPNLGAKK